MLTANRNPEQLIRDAISLAVLSCWLIQNKSSFNPGESLATSEADSTLTSFDKTADKNFQNWIFKKQAGTTRYTTEQVQWLRMIKAYIATTFYIGKESFEPDPCQQARRSRKNMAAIRRSNRCHY